MPKAKSKAQQAKLWALAKQGVLSEREAKARSRKGKAYKAMPTWVKRK